MITWILKAARLLVLILVIWLIGSFTLAKILEKTQKAKPSINLVPEEINAPHFVNSMPAHNQFLVGSPLAVVINFDTNLDKSSAAITVNGKNLKIDFSSTEKSLNSVPPDNIDNGIYKVQYKVCFTNNTCSEGQFAYNIDDTRITEFANHTTKRLVEIILTDDIEMPPNILINREATIKWNNQTTGSIKIKSPPQNFNNYYSGLNSEEIKKGESFSYQFNIRGEYLWYLDGSPKISGRIFVQR